MFQLRGFQQNQVLSDHDRLASQRPARMPAEKNRTTGSCLRIVDGVRVDREDPLRVGGEKRCFRVRIVPASHSHGMADLVAAQRLPQYQLKDVDVPFGRGKQSTLASRAVGVWLA